MWIFEMVCRLRFSYERECKLSTTVYYYCIKGVCVMIWLSEWGSGGRLLLWSGRTEEAVNRILQSAETIR